MVEAETERASLLLFPSLSFFFYPLYPLHPCYFLFSWGARAFRIRAFIGPPAVCGSGC